MTQSESRPPTRLCGDIPQDEAVFYEETSHKEAAFLASLNSIEELAEATQSLSSKVIGAIARGRNGGSFPEPRSLWLASTFEAAAEYESFNFLAPLDGKMVLQLGGRGADAVKFMLGGARSASLISPVESEVRCGEELARLCGVNVSCQIGLAESIPCSDETFDIVYSSGCAHHFETDKAFREISRVLRKGGRFAAIDPWLGPGYRLGIRIFGKREREVHCSPLTEKRIESLPRCFRRYSVKQHGTLTRYPMIVLGKLGLEVSPSVAWWITRFDDTLCSLLHARSLGSCVAIMAEK